MQVIPRRGKDNIDSEGRGGGRLHVVDISRSVSVLEEIVYAPSPCVSHCSFLIWLLPHVVSDLFCIYFSFLLLQRFPCRRFSFWSSGFGPAVTRGAFVLRPSWGTEKGLSFRRISQLRTCGFVQGCGVTLSVPHVLARGVHAAGMPLPKTFLAIRFNALFASMQPLEAL